MCLWYYWIPRLIFQSYFDFIVAILKCGLCPGEVWTVNNKKKMCFLPAIAVAFRFYLLRWLIAQGKAHFCRVSRDLWIYPSNTRQKVVRKWKKPRFFQSPEKMRKSYTWHLTVFIIQNTHRLVVLELLTLLMDCSPWRSFFYAYEQWAHAWPSS